MKTTLMPYLLLLLLYTGTLSAQGFRGVYVGASIGRSFVNASYKDIDSGDLDLKLDKEEIAYKLYAGLPFGGFLGLESGYVSTGKATDKVNNINLSSKTSGFDVLAVGSIDLALLRLFGKAGILFWNSRNTAEPAPESSLFIPTQTEESDGQDFAWGFGVELRLSRIGVRAEWEKFHVGVPDALTMLSAGLVLLF
jgi:hypothetical protein